MNIKMNRIALMLALGGAVTLGACDSGSGTEEGGTEEGATEGGGGSHETVAQALSAGFTAQTVEGRRAGGSRDASEVNGDCVGYIPAEPHAAVTLDAEMGVAFTATSTTDGADLTLVVEGPGGVYHCDDDGSDVSLMPLVAGTMPAGTYNVFVGNYDQEMEHNFVLHTNPWTDPAAVVPPTTPPPAGTGAAAPGINVQVGADGTIDVQGSGAVPGGTIQVEAGGSGEPTSQPQ